MLRYSYYDVFTKEIPDELSLGFIILGCDVHCKDCHSKQVWDINSKNQGLKLTYEVIDRAVEEQIYTTCALFFGGEWEPNDLYNILKYTKVSHSMKCALYSGRDLEYFNNSSLLKYLDYIKVGSYNREYGSIDKETTNQRLYTVFKGKIDKDITNKMWRSCNEDTV